MVVPIIAVSIAAYALYKNQNRPSLAGHTRIQTCTAGQCEYMTVVQSTDKEEAARQLMLIYKRVLPVYNSMRKKPGFVDQGDLVPSDLLESDGYLTADNKTTYLFDKSSLHVCLREKSGTLYSETEKKFNRIIYVVLHELTHRLTRSWNHTPEFWENFKTVLKEAIRLGCYSPENFTTSQWTHCGKQKVTTGGYV